MKCAEVCHFVLYVTRIYREYPCRKLDTKTKLDKRKDEFFCVVIIDTITRYQSLCEIAVKDACAQIGFPFLQELLACIVQQA